jgi:hypothetical protein
MTRTIAKVTITVVIKAKFTIFVFDDIIHEKVHVYSC